MTISLDNIIPYKPGRSPKKALLGTAWREPLKRKYMSANSDIAPQQEETLDSALALPNVSILREASTCDSTQIPQQKIAASEASSNTASPSINCSLSDVNFSQYERLFDKATSMYSNRETSQENLTMVSEIDGESSDLNPKNDYASSIRNGVVAEQAVQYPFEVDNISTDLEPNEVDLLLQQKLVDLSQSQAESCGLTDVEFALGKQKVYTSNGDNEVAEKRYAPISGMYQNYIPRKRVPDASLDMLPRKKRTVRKGRSNLRSAIVPKNFDWEITKILSRRTVEQNGCMETSYKVKWKSTWVAAGDLDSPILLREFESRKWL